MPATSLSAAAPGMRMCPVAARAAFALVACLVIGAGPAMAAGDHYWELGAGTYFGGLGNATELDFARYDWLYLCFGNIGATPETVAILNRLLEINPDLKIVIRVWPIMGAGDCPENRYQATFLHYLYKDGVRERVNQTIHDQVRVVLDNISRPENVVGLTFLEELPGHFSGGPFKTNQTGGELTWDLKRFQAEIEAERGKPLVWDDETRLWWGGKWVQVLGEIHAAMKQAAEGRLIWYYQQTNHTSLDMVAEGAPLDARMLMPIHWGEIIKPGLCEGFFAYPNTRFVWDRYLKLATDNDWLFFSQVSHPGRMRGCTWDECVEMAKTRDPHNMGYFFYCSGDCAAGDAWNDDPGIPDGPMWNTRGYSIKYHVRRFLAQQDVGMDIVRAQPALELGLDLPLEGVRAGEMLHPRVVVQNALEPSFYLDPAEAIARSVTVTISPPPGFTIGPDSSPPARLELGDLAPGELRVADWWVQAPADYAGTPAGPFTITGETTGRPPTTVQATGDTSLPVGEPHEVHASGDSWIEPALRLVEGTVRPAIEIEALRGLVHNPSVGDETARVRYVGTLEEGMRAVLSPEGSRVFVLPLVDDDGSARADANDPSGYGAISDGYLVVKLRVGRQVQPGMPLRVSISGKCAGGAQSHVVLRFKTADGQQDVGTLTNRLKPEWSQQQAEVAAPEGAVSLDWVYLYRFKQEGSVWYGPARIERGDVPTDGQDVSANVQGTFPALTRGTVSVLSYEDEDPPDPRPRVRVQLILPQQP